MRSINQCCYTLYIIYFEPIPLSSNMHNVKILELPYFSIKTVTAVNN